ncbi:TRAP transporter small permease [Bordetella sp. BOR01]|uniref:TRAP transporter small permease n=1 Tax=Bordetella sp. BOR01 TaxID=2854779 RepID=UPI001C488D40|nr:TRAP transporter small permease [Bordetella sp. BOR01]MBV7484620.1 TRAP transporter small permease [Bordetella sp. BOR01]
MASLLGRALTVVEWIEDLSGGVLLFIAATLVFVQIVLRILGLSFSGLYEIAAFCAVWSVFLTAGVGIQRNVHVRVDVLLMVCPPPIAYVLRLLSALLMVGMSGMLCYSGYLLIAESLTFGDRTLGMISIPMWIPQIIMPLGGVLMLVHSIVHLLDVFHAGPRAPGAPATPELSANTGNI